jgi:hypothetical protein
MRSRIIGRPDEILLLDDTLAISAYGNKPSRRRI